MEMCRFIFWVLGVNVLVDGAVGTLSLWNIHDLCGAEISRFDFAGEVSFDAEHIPNSENEEACSVTITPETLDKDEDNMILFYFTTFELHTTCTGMNVTVRDGRGNKDKINKGLPYNLCGINSTLTEEVYSTSGESLFIQVNWSRESLLAKQLRGTFVLKFVTYHTGSCYASDVHECSNGHCIPLLYNCSVDIKACGHVEDECAEKPGDEEHTDFISSIFRYILVLIAFVCIISLLKVMFKKGRRKCQDIADTLERCFHCLRTKCRRCRNSNCFSCTSKLRLPTFIRSCLRSSDSEMTDDSTNSRENVPAESVINPAFSTSSDQIHQLTVHDSPPPYGPPDMTSPNIDPPSYEEVMASAPQTSPSMQITEQAQTDENIMTSNTVTVPPSYDENVLNSGEYTSRPDRAIVASDSDIYLATDEELSSDPPIQSIHSSLQTERCSVLNEYISHFGIELSDEYSTDSDWDSDNNSSVAVSNQVPQSQPASNVNEMDSDWDVDSNSSGAVLNQITETQSALNENVIDSDWDADSNSSGAVLNHINETQSADWDADSNSSGAVLNQVTETQSASNMNVIDEADNPVPPPSYDQAVPPPYYYDYIANVSRYK